MLLAGDRRLKTELERHSLYLQVSNAHVYNIGFSYIPFPNQSPFSGLRHVSISHRCEIATMSPLWILTLPNELETLKLAFKRCFQAVYLPVDHELATVISKESRDGALTNPRDSVLAFNRKFPVLKILVFRDPSLRVASNTGTGFRGWNVDQMSNFLQSMPETLDELILFESGQFGYTYNFWSQLPHSLTTASIRYDGLTRSLLLQENGYQTLDLATFPSITTLQVLLAEPANWTNLPVVLRELDLQLWRFGSDTNVFEALPHSLESLTVGLQESKTRISSLPPKLVSLRIGTPLSPTQTKHFFKELPPTLRHLHLAEMLEDKHPARLDLLPKTLTSLKLTVDWQPPELFSSLSRLEQLESLDITQTLFQRDQLPPSRAPTLPCTWKFGPNLRKLHWKALYSIIDCVFLSQLPDSLQELVLGNVETAQSSHQATFPKSLKLLSIGTLVDSYQWIMQLNDDLKGTQPDDDPMSINPISISAESPERISGGVTSTNMLGNPFPASLESLSMAPPEPLNERFLSRLPRSLSSLQLKHNTIKDEGAIRALPPKLQKLDLVGAHPVSDASFHLLPRSLTHLNLSCALNYENITDNGVPHLPPQLTLLSMLSVKLSLVGVASLPRSITRLRLGSITLPQINPFKSAFDAIRAIPPGASVFPKLDGSDIRTWASKSSQYDHRH